MTENEDWPEDNNEMVVEEPSEETVEASQEAPPKKPKKSKFGFLKRKNKIEEQPKEEKKEEIKKPIFHKKPKEPGEPGFIKKRLNKWKRTLEVAKKPTKDEFKQSAKVTGIGIALLGAIGFIIFMIYHIIVR